MSNYDWELFKEKMGVLGRGMAKAVDRVGTSTGEYWSEANADFEATNPTVGDRVLRSVNPMTSFGSALGALSDAAAEGFPPRDTAIALMQSLPTFGSVLTKTGSAAAGAAKAIPAITVNDYLKTLRAFALSTASSVAADEVQAAERNSPNQLNK